MRVVAPEQVHLTLAFLGHRSPDEIPGLAEVTARFAGRAAPPLRTGGGLWLSPRRAPRPPGAARGVSGALGRLPGGLGGARGGPGHRGGGPALPPPPPGGRRGPG